MRAIRPGLLLVLLPLTFGLPQAAEAQEARPRARSRVQNPATILQDPAVRVTDVEVAEETGKKCPPPPPVHPCPPTEGAKRRILDDGGVETTYTDGTVKVVHPDGSTLTTHPDGTSIEDNGGETIWRDAEGNETAKRDKWILVTNVPYATPPEPPADGSQLARWLAYQNNILKETIESILANEAGGAASLARYLEREQGLGLYQQFASRSELLQRLLKR